MRSPTQSIFPLHLLLIFLVFLLATPVLSTTNETAVSSTNVTSSHTPATATGTGSPRKTPTFGPTSSINSSPSPLNNHQSTTEKISWILFVVSVLGGVLA